MQDGIHSFDVYPGGGGPKEGGGKLHIKEDGREYRAAVLGVVGWTEVNLKNILFSQEAACYIYIYETD